MYGRVKNDEPVHQMDPLFVALFERAHLIDFWFENTTKGVHVKETSTDSCTAQIIQVLQICFP